MNTPDAKTLMREVGSGDRRALARAITLAESTRDDHQAVARSVLEGLRDPARAALRIGLTGTPGVGKSTFLESFGLYLCDQGLRVAVLAVDPSSRLSGGAILGDKTRMPDLSRRKAAFIRPSPSSNTLGGVAARTRQVIELCEGAGYDVVIVETVGVGQSETLVAEMTDIFALLLAPAGGDELQGVKRGIMEMADLVVVNKADGDLREQAVRTAADYAGAMRLLRRPAHTPEGFPRAMTISALEREGLADVWAAIKELSDWRDENGITSDRRRSQAIDAFRRALDEALLSRAKAANQAAIDAVQADVAEGKAAPEAAADALARDLISHTKSL